MTFNSNPLEKQLLHLNLSKGLNERDRPETADPATTITRLENLVQDQQGAWVKRPGTYYMAQPPGSIAHKLLKLREGLGAIGSSGEFFQWAENSGTFRRNGDTSPFLVKADQVVAAGPTLNAVCASSATGTNYHVTLTDSGKGTANAGEASSWTLSVYDRHTGATVGKYDVAQLFGVSYVLQAVATLVDDRYVHLWAYDGGASITGVGGLVIDTVSLPANGTAGLTFQNTSAATDGDMLDLTHGSSRSFLLTAPSATITYVLAMDNSGNVAEQIATINSIRNLSYSPYGTPAVWGVSAGSFEYFDAASLAPSGGAVHGGTFSSSMMTQVDSLGVMWVADQYNASLAGGVSVPSLRLYKSSVIGVPTFGGIYGEVQGWTACSQPMEVHLPNNTTMMCLHVRKQMAATGVDGPAQTPHVVINITPEDITGVSVGYTPYAGNRYHYSARVVATLEPAFAANVTKTIRRSHSVAASYTEFGCTIPMLVAARSIGFAIATITVNRVGRGGVTEVMGYANYVSGGTHAKFVGGGEPNEVGFVDIPRIGAVANATVGLPNGLVRYVAVYRHVDESGAVTWSRVSDIVSASPALRQVTVEVMAPAVTNRDTRRGAGVVASPVVNSVELYRTTAGGTIYYLCAGTQPGSTQTLVLQAVSNVYALSDNMSDATLATKAQLFRQPGTPNSAVDRYAPPGGGILCQHKDRLFTADTLGSRVCYSSFFVDGETAWFNPAFSFFVHGGSGPITGLASMDGRLFVFKRDAIFVVDGDGPGEAGVTGNEYSPPNRLATEHGCVDHRTVLVTTDGLMYRSPRGIELLNRGLQVKYIGERAQNTLAANQFNHGAVIDPTGKARWLISPTDAPAQKELVYDFTSDSWTTNTYQTYGWYDLCVPDLMTYGSVPVYSQASGYVCRQTAPVDDLYYDVPYSSYVPFVIETGWIRTGQQNRARFTKALALLKNNASCNHKLTMSLSVQYNDATVQTYTWEPAAVLAMELEQLEMAIARQEVMAYRLTVTDGAPTDTATYPIGSGKGPDVLVLSFEVAPKMGAPKGPAGHQA